MRALSLDYRRNDRKAQYGIGLVLLVLVAVFATGLAWHYRQLNMQAGQMSALLDRIEAQRSVADSAKLPDMRDTRLRAAEAIQAREVLQQLNRPWEQLFISLEAANGHEIALLALEPDWSSGHIMISGEAKHFGALLDYIRRLQSSEHLSGVYLQHHQLQIQEDGKPVRFTLDALWIS